MMWPDMDWVYILTYDLWNFAYTYNCISDHSVYCGMLLLLSCTIPSFFIVSLLALVSNAGLFIYQISVMIKKKKNPLKDELYTDTKHYKKIVAQN